MKRVTKSKRRGVLDEQEKAALVLGAESYRGLESPLGPTSLRRFGKASMTSSVAVSPYLATSVQREGPQLLKSAKLATAPKFAD